MNYADPVRPARFPVAMLLSLLSLAGAAGCIVVTAHEYGLRARGGGELGISRGIGIVWTLALTLIAAIFGAVARPRSPASWCSLASNVLVALALALAIYTVILLAR